MSRGTVLLTGSNGFTGRYVRTELESAGYKVLGAVMGTPNVPNEIALDIMSIDSCRYVMETTRPDYLMHLARVDSATNSADEVYYQVNVIGTLNLLEATLEAKLAPQKVVIASSASVYGDGEPGIFTESRLPSPNNHYAVSMLSMEHMVMPLNEYFPIVIARPFNSIGVGQPSNHLISNIVSHFARRSPFVELGLLDLKSDFSDVRTMARAYRGLLENGSAGQIVNVSSGVGRSLRDIVSLLEKISGHRIEVRESQRFTWQAEAKELVGATDKLNTIIGDIGTITLEDTLRWMSSTIDYSVVGN